MTIHSRPMATTSITSITLSTSAEKAAQDPKVHIPSAEAYRNIRRANLLQQHAAWLVAKTKEVVNAETVQHNIDCQLLLTVYLPNNIPRSMQDQPDANQLTHFGGFEEGQLHDASLDAVPHAWALQGVKDRESNHSDPSKLPGGQTSLLLANRQLVNFRLSLDFDPRTRAMRILLWDREYYDHCGKTGEVPEAIKRLSRQRPMGAYRRPAHHTRPERPARPARHVQPEVQEPPAQERVSASEYFEQRDRARSERQSRSSSVGSLTPVKSAGVKFAQFAGLSEPEVC